MAYKTRQELFDMAFIGLRSQGFERAMNGNSCMYRAPDGKRCAIGWCVPDDDYSEKFENNALSVIAAKLAPIVGIEQDDIGFAVSLQGCHDGNASPIYMEAALRDFAAGYGLTIPA